MDLPADPPKASDPHSCDGEATTQAEAIPPEILASIVREAIETRQDSTVRYEVLADEIHAKAAPSSRNEVNYLLSAAEQKSLVWRTSVPPHVPSM